MYIFCKKQNNIDEMKENEQEINDMCFKCARI